MASIYDRMRFYDRKRYNLEYDPSLKEPPLGNISVYYDIAAKNRQYYYYEARRDVFALKTAREQSNILRFIENCKRRVPAKPHIRELCPWAITRTQMRQADQEWLESMADVEVIDDTETESSRGSSSDSGESNASRESSDGSRNHRRGSLLPDENGHAPVLPSGEWGNRPQRGPRVLPHIPARVNDENDQIIVEMENQYANKHVSKENHEKIQKLLDIGFNSNKKNFDYTLPNVIGKETRIRGFSRIDEVSLQWGPSDKGPDSHLLGSRTCIHRFYDNSKNEILHIDAAPFSTRKDKKLNHWETWMVITSTDEHIPYLNTCMSKTKAAYDVCPNPPAWWKENTEQPDNTNVTNDTNQSHPISNMNPDIDPVKEKELKDFMPENDVYVAFIQVFDVMHTEFVPFYYELAPLDGKMFWIVYTREPPYISIKWMQSDDVCACKNSKNHKEFTFTLHDQDYVIVYSKPVSSRRDGRWNAYMLSLMVQGSEYLLPYTTSEIPGSEVTDLEFQKGLEQVNNKDLILPPLPPPADTPPADIPPPPAKIPPPPADTSPADIPPPPAKIPPAPAKISPTIPRPSQLVRPDTPATREPVVPHAEYKLDKTKQTFVEVLITALSFEYTQSMYWPLPELDRLTAWLVYDAKKPSIYLKWVATNDQKSLLSTQPTEITFREGNKKDPIYITVQPFSDPIIRRLNNYVLSIHTKSHKSKIEIMNTCMPGTQASDTSFLKNKTKQANPVYDARLYDDAEPPEIEGNREKFVCQIQDQGIKLNAIEYERSQGPNNPFWFIWDAIRGDVDDPTIVMDLLNHWVLVTNPHKLPALFADAIVRIINLKHDSVPTLKYARPDPNTDTWDMPTQKHTLCVGLLLCKRDDGQRGYQGAYVVTNVEKDNQGNESISKEWKLYFVNMHTLTKYLLCDSAKLQKPKQTVIVQPIFPRFNPALARENKLKRLQHVVPVDPCGSGSFYPSAGWAGEVYG